MQRIALPPLEQRLQSRYLTLVHAHMHSAPKLAAGVASLPSTRSSFAATQAAWRFHNNDRVTLPALIEPLRAVGRDRLATAQMPFALLVHDWSKLAFAFPKRDLTQLTHATDVGYELTTTLLVSADDGSPLAPMEIHLKTGGGVLSTRRRAPKDVPHLDQVLPTMKAARTWDLTKPLVHVIDREADSVDVAVHSLGLKIPNETIILQTWHRCRRSQNRYGKRLRLSFKRRSCSSSNTTRSASLNLRTV